MPNLGKMGTTNGPTRGSANNDADEEEGGRGGWQGVQQPWAIPLTRVVLRPQWFDPRLRSWGVMLQEP